jgi:cobalt transporter subunit CbtB
MIWRISASYPQDIAVFARISAHPINSAPAFKPVANVAIRLDPPCTLPPHSICKVPRMNAKRLGMKWECGQGRLKPGPKATTAPATVCGEHPSIRHWWQHREGRRRATTREPGDRPCRKINSIPSGVTGKDYDMTTTTKTKVLPQTNVATMALVFLMGATMLFVAGFAHSATLHDVAHDVRHASGFPCH